MKNHTNHKHTSSHKSSPPRRTEACSRSYSAHNSYCGSSSVFCQAASFAGRSSSDCTYKRLRAIIEGRDARCNLSAYRISLAGGETIVVVLGDEPSPALRGQLDRAFAGTECYAVPADLLQLLVLRRAEVGLGNG